MTTTEPKKKKNRCPVCNKGLMPLDVGKMFCILHKDLNPNYI